MRVRHTFREQTWYMGSRRKSGNPRREAPGFPWSVSEDLTWTSTNTWIWCPKKWFMNYYALKTHSRIIIVQTFGKVYILLKRALLDSKWLSCKCTYSHYPCVYIFHTCICHILNFWYTFTDVYVLSGVQYRYYKIRAQKGQEEYERLPIQVGKTMLGVGPPMPTTIFALFFFLPVGWHEQS